MPPHHCNGPSGWPPGWDKTSSIPSGHQRACVYVIDPPIPSPLALRASQLAQGACLTLHSSYDNRSPVPCRP